ncbi:MAG: ComEC family competence protein [Clostridia bacterium]|nr:ComEC family competence protein [Clostridia bacterium]
MKRFVNVRIPVLLACSLALGIASGYFLHFYNADTLYLIAAIPVAAVFFIISVCIKKPKIFIFALILLALFIAGAFNSYCRLQDFGKSEIKSDQPIIINGVVSEKGETSYEEYIIIDNVKAEKRTLSGKVKVYLPEAYGEFCDIGYSVEFLGQLKFGDVYPYGELNRNAEENIKYTCSVLGKVYSEYGYSLFGSIRSQIKSVLYNNLDKDTASICYAMLVGNTQGIDTESLQSFRFGGIAHIFAVSGLHIGLVFGIVTLLCKKLKINKYAAVTVSIALILFYAAICGFSLSSVRAVIMCATSAVTRLFHLKRDGLNSLAFAVIIILLITPLSLFSLGFQLSACSVGGIFLFSNKIKKLLCKIKVPRGIAGSIGTSFGAQLGTLPVMMSGFGYISGAGLLLNIIVIPAVSLLFTPLFVFTAISLAIPQAGAALTYAVLPLEAVLSFLISSGFENALIRGFGPGLFALLYYAGITVFSDKFNIKLAPRVITSAMVLAILTLFVIIQTYSPAEGHKIIINGSQNGGCVIVKSQQGSVLIITEDAASSRVIDALNNNYSLNLSGVIILGGEECVTAYDTDLNCKDVYVSNLYTPVQPYKNITVHYEKEFTAGGVKFEYVDGQNIIFYSDGIIAGVSASKEIKIEKCDILISRYLNLNTETTDFFCETQHTVYFSLDGYIYNCYEYGEMVYRTHLGNITYKRPPRH